MADLPDRSCDIEIWPRHAGEETVTIAAIEGRGDEAVDLLIVTLSTDEAMALADILLSAARSRSDKPTYALRSLRVHD